MPTNGVFIWSILTPEDYQTAAQVLGGALRRPDLVIAPHGKPYLYRWHVIQRSVKANVYLHIQVASDPDPALHDHPWDNMTVVLAGGYDETYKVDPTSTGHRATKERELRKGDVVSRTAETAHRLVLPEGIPYTMTLFSTGPVRRDWGFWRPEGWVSHKKLIDQDGNVTRQIGGV